MKTVQLKNKFVTFMILIGLLFSINSCKSDDDDDDTFSKTFLELYGGTTWVQAEGEYLSYIRLINNENNFAEGWEYWDEGDCYDYNNFVLEGSVEVIENSKDRFIVKATVDGYTETITLTIQGEFLNAVIQWTEGIESGEEIMSLDKTNVNVDNLEICPD